jgi:hypothetical protein
MSNNRNIGKVRKTNIKIWQHNLNKSRTCQHDLISSGKLAKWQIDIAAFQEPAINGFGQMVASKDWKMIYPSTHAKNPEKTRSVILIRDNLLTDCYASLSVVRLGRG